MTQKHNTLLIHIFISTGYPQPQYRWLKNGHPLGDFSSEHFFRILNTKPSDAGSYQCVAKNDVGSIYSEKIDVIVAYMGVFEDQTERTITVQSGQAAILDLPYIESQPEPLITWQNDEERAPYGPKYADTDGHQLIILSADDTDQRSYRARALNAQSGKEENSAYIRLNVVGDSYKEIAPEIIVKPKSTNVTIGKQLVNLYCIANARPLHELETLWFKDDIIVENSGIIKYLQNILPLECMSIL